MEGFMTRPARNLEKKVEQIAPSDRRVIQTLLWALKPLSNLRGRSIPLPYAVTFLTVALEEGKPVGRYAHELDFNRYVMSRYMQCIGDRGRNGEAGLGLVTVKQTRGYPTRTEVFLTDKGRAVAAQVFQNLGRLTEIRKYRRSSKPLRTRKITGVVAPEAAKQVTA
jgi:hypothetical protein